MSESRNAMKRKSLKRKNVNINVNENVSETNEDPAKKIALNSVVSNELLRTQTEATASQSHRKEPIKNEGFKIDTSKYEEKFFKHPFLPLMRTRNIKYTRCAPRKSHLTTGDVERRLELIKNSLPHHRDIIKIKKNPRLTETEKKCCHRILSEGSFRKFTCTKNENKLMKKYGPIIWIQKKYAVDPRVKKPSVPMVLENEKLSIDVETEKEVQVDATCGSKTTNYNILMQGTDSDTFQPTNGISKASLPFHHETVSNNSQTTEYTLNKFPGWTLTPINQFQYPFQSMDRRILPPVSHLLQIPDSRILPSLQFPNRNILPQVHHTLQFSNPRIVSPVDNSFQFPYARILPPVPHLLQFPNSRFLPPVYRSIQHPFQRFVDLGTQMENTVFQNNFHWVPEKEHIVPSSNYAPSTNFTYPQATNLEALHMAKIPSLSRSINSSSVNNYLSKSTNQENEAIELDAMSTRNLETSLIAHTLPSIPFKSPETFSLIPQCLVPPHLKYLVGSGFLKPEDVLLLILEWNIHCFTYKQNLPKVLPLSYALKKISNSYERFGDYYNTFLPLLLLEALYKLYDCFVNLKYKASFLTEITSYSLQKDHVIVKCKTVFNGDFDKIPDVGDIAIINFRTKSSEHCVKVFGYVKYVDYYAESKCSTLREDANSVCSQIFNLIFMCVYDSDDIDKKLPVCINVLYPVKRYLKQSQALYFLKQSPLLKGILKPRNSEGLCRFFLSPKVSEYEISECVKTTIPHISLAHPVPVITVIETKSKGDHLKIIPTLIREIKNRCKKMKVLLYVKKRRTLNKVVEKIALLDQKLIITCKRSNVSPRFHKFLFDDLVKKKEMQILRKIEELKLKGKMKQEIKEGIVRKSEVVLSRISDVNNDFFFLTLLDTANIGEICCIMDEAHGYTEPETLIPTVYGFSKLILIGRTKKKAKIQSTISTEYGFEKSYFQRACELNLCQD